MGSTCVWISIRSMRYVWRLCKLWREKIRSVHRILLTSTIIAVSVIVNHLYAYYSDWFFSIIFTLYIYSTYLMMCPHSCMIDSQDFSRWSITSFTLFLFSKSLPKYSEYPIQKHENIFILHFLHSWMSDKLTSLLHACAKSNKTHGNNRFEIARKLVDVLLSILKD